MTNYKLIFKDNFDPEEIMYRAKTILGREDISSDAILAFTILKLTEYTKELEDRIKKLEKINET